MSIAIRFGAEDEFVDAEEFAAQNATVKAGIQAMKSHDAFIPKLKTRIAELEAEKTALESGKTESETQLREALAKAQEEVTELTEKAKAVPSLEASLEKVKEALTASAKKVKELEAENQKLTKVSEEHDRLRDTLVEYGELEVAKLVLEFQQKNAANETDKAVLERESGLVGKELAKLAREANILVE
jgi:hypothetical protein